MTLQEAYNKGLDDAEGNVLRILTQIVLGLDVEPFMNPKLQAIAKVLEERSEYYRLYSERRNNAGKHFKRKVIEQMETLTNADIIVN